MLAPQAADVAHPAFQKLFVETEFVPEHRRPPRDAPAALRATSSRSGPRTSRRSRTRPAAASSTRPTGPASSAGAGRSARRSRSSTGGRCRTRSARCSTRSSACAAASGIAPGATAHAIFSTVVAESREEVLDLADKYRDPATFERAATLAWTQAQVQLHHLGIETDEAHLFQRLANRILYSDPTLRPVAAVLARNERGAPGLWAHGISGDLPIVLVRIDEAEDLAIVRQLLRAHEYWRLKLLASTS